jgi:nucleotide-binding universal stress UspA family protein
VEIAKQHGAAIHLVHAAPVLPRLLARRFRLSQTGREREALDGELQRVRKAGVAAHAHLAQGNIVDALTAKARALAADLVVVGAGGRTFPDAMIGSTAERLIAVDQHRVLLVRRPASRPYREVVLAAHDDSRLKEQAAAAQLLAAGVPSLLHAYEAPFEMTLVFHGVQASELRKYRAAARREAEARMRKLMEKAGLDSFELVLRDGAATSVLQRVDRDALLVLSRGRSVMRHIVLGSVTRAVVAYGASDVLLV